MYTIDQLSVMSRAKGFKKATSPVVRMRNPLMWRLMTHIRRHFEGEGFESVLFSL
ncbi:hypothetical protein BDIM_14480 [Brevundimonas diminuta ATCC 11568]|nr:hypothetical protein BDIM_14480 [Brevundimonas diminuta ATCC 11568]